VRVHAAAERARGRGSHSASCWCGLLWAVPQAKALENETADDRRRQDQLSREIDERKRQIEMRHKLREENRVQLAEAKERRDQLHQERQYVRGGCNRRRRRRRRGDGDQRFAGADRSSGLRRDAVRAPQ